MLKRERERKKKKKRESCFPDLFDITFISMMLIRFKLFPGDESESGNEGESVSSSSLVVYFFFFLSFVVSGGLFTSKTHLVCSNSNPLTFSLSLSLSLRI